MNELQIFNNEEFGEIRTVTDKVDAVWFCGKDVANALGYERGAKAIADHVDREDTHEVPIQDSIGRMQNTPFINESGLYSLVLSSKLPNAKKFKRWVTSEVLPSIRRTGQYQIPTTTAGQIKLLAQGCLELEQKIDSVDEDLQTFKKEMPLLAIECETITKAKRKKVFELTGGKDSNAYQDKSLRGRIYKDLESQLIREFGVGSYKAIKRNQTEKAVEIITSYELPLCLKEEVENTNSQMNLEI